MLAKDDKGTSVDSWVQAKIWKALTRSGRGYEWSSNVVITYLAFHSGKQNPWKQPSVS